jgi:hypothetical protein
MPKLFSMTIACAAFALLGIGLSQSASAQWGTLKGQVLLDGEIPTIKPLVAKGDGTARDAAVCAAQAVPDEKLVVDPETKGIANVVIYLPKKPEKVFPGLEKSANATVSFDQKGCRFVPHVMIVRTDQQVVVLSDDAVAHNTHTTFIKNRNDNFLVSPKERTGITLKPLTIVEKVPQKVVCDIHNWMKAYWVIVDHPYAAVTNEKGEFVIPELPVGKHEFIVWQEESGYLDKKYTVTIKEGTNTEKPLKFTAKQILK